MSGIFALTRFWTSYDVFSRQKMSTFKSSRPAVLELAARYNDLMAQLASSVKGPAPDEAESEAEKLLFTEMCEICLWGNATDLSLLTSLTYEDIQQLQGSDARRSQEKNILVNDVGAAYDVLKSAQKRPGQADRRVDIVLDNAGFELFVDLVFAGYLLAADLATTIVLHPKSVPWFVSDVMPADFAGLLHALMDARTFYSTPSEDDRHAGKKLESLSDEDADQLSRLAAHWADLHRDGRLILRPNRFWTHGGSYWRLPKSDARLWEDFRESELVIFKVGVRSRRIGEPVLIRRRCVQGDLNYRKLTADVSDTYRQRF